MSTADLLTATGDGMTGERPRNDAAMADILSSIRKIVAEDERRGARGAGGGDDILELTPDMRVADDAPPPPAAPAEPFEMSADEALVADVARAVVRDELDGETGRRLMRQVRDMVRAEVARALAEERGARD